MLEYQSRFERLLNQVKDWSERQLVGTFIEGHNPDIRCEVKARQPYTMTAAISYARLHEKKINRENRRNISDNKQMINKPLAPSIPNRNPNTRRQTRE